MKKFIVRFLAFIGFLALLPLFFIIAFEILPVKNLMMPESGILEINLDDEFPEVPSSPSLSFILGKKETTFLQLLQALDKARLDHRIKGIALRLNTPTLGLAQIDEMRTLLKQFQKNGKFVMAHATSFGDLTPNTKAYYLVGSADQLWMQPFSSLNLTGIHVDQPFLGKFLKELGIHAQIDTRKEYKNAFSFITDDHFTVAHQEATLHLLSTIYDSLLAGISEDRELPRELLREITKMTPLGVDVEAKEKGLVDVLGYVDEFKEAALRRAGPKSSFISLDAYRAALQEKQKTSEEKIAVIYGVGAVTQEAHPSYLLGGMPIISAEEIRQAFEDALQNPKIKAIVLRVDSPGGSAIASETIRHMVLVAQQKNVPVIASIGNVAASGGYWFIAPCKKILASPLSITGSIGVVMGKLVFKEFLQKWGINVDHISVGENGSLWSPLSPYTTTQQISINRFLDVIYLRFKEIVSEGRNLPFDHINEISKGRVWTGVDAKRLGLIDRFGSFQDAIEVAKSMAGIAKENPIELIIYPEEKLSLASIFNPWAGLSSVVPLKMLVKDIFKIFKNVITPQLQLMEPLLPE